MGRLSLAWIMGIIALVVWTPVMLLAQEPSLASPSSPMTAPPAEWQSSVVVGFFVTTFWEWLKRREWIKFTNARAAYWLQRVSGVLVATATAAGLNYTFDPVAGRLVIDGLTLTAALGVLKDTSWQFVVNQAMYHGLVKPAPRAHDGSGKTGRIVLED
jgi:hypothetical protein